MGRVDLNGTYHKNLPVRVSIARSMGQTDGKPIHIEIEDASSGLYIIHVRMTLAEFAECITGLGHIDGTAEYFGNPNIGKKRENKTVLVDFDCYGENKESEANKIIKKFEKEGWECYRDDFFNGHRQRKNKQHEVTVYRYVEANSGS